MSTNQNSISLDLTGYDEENPYLYSEEVADLLYRNTAPDSDSKNRARAKPKVTAIDDIGDTAESGGQENPEVTADDASVKVSEDEEQANPEFMVNIKSDNWKLSRIKQLNCLPKTLNSLTTLEKALFVLVFILLVFAIVKFSTTPVNQKKNIDRLCLSRGCVNVAGNVASLLDESVKPCDDFYQFSCGGWQKSNPLPPGSSSWSQFAKVWRNNQHILKNILELNNTVDNPSKTKARRLYRACVELEAIDKVGTKPLLDFVESLGGWEILGTWNESTFDFNATLKKFATYGASPFIGFEVAPDEKMPTQRIINIGWPGLIAGLPKFYINKTVTEDKILSAYLKFMTTVATLLGGERNTSRSRMLEILNLEKELALISPTLEELRDSQANYYKTKLASLKDITPAVDWSDFIQSTFRNFANITIDDEEPVVVSSRQYMLNVSKIIYATPKRVIHNYFTFTAISSFLDTLGEEFRLAGAELRKAKNGGDSNCAERWRYCVSIVDDVLGKELGRSFVRKQFDSDSKSSAENMVVAIKKSFKRNLKKTGWMDEETKQKADEKVDAVLDLVGFSDKILNQSYIQNQYKDLDFSNAQDYFDYIWAIIRFAVTTNLKDLRKSIIRDEWLSTPATVNAYYAPLRNVIVFPAGILQPPFYSMDAPQAMNFGGIGMVVGHELTHGFDDTGRNYDASGILGMWWGNSTIEKFNAKTKCMVDQYSRYKFHGQNVDGNLTLGENIADNGGIKLAYSAYQEWKKCHDEIELPSLNYTNDQLFFIAFAQSPDSVRRLLRDDPRTFHYGNYVVWGNRHLLVGVSGDPMFLWISSNSCLLNLLLVRSHQAEFLIVEGLIQGRNNVTNMQMWCSVVTPEEARNNIFTDVHSPSTARVIGTLSNFPKFSQAFGCPTGSPMNPDEKCEVW